VDFVFTNGAGAWDNNGGADWHVSVTGAEPPPHVVDGTLDAGLAPVASCGGRDLYADYDGRWLYVAAPPVGATSGLDHFAFVARPSTSGSVAAPWAKAGTAAAWDLMLGNEDSNNWAGWFDAAGTVVTSGLTKAVGSVLEGMVDVSAWWTPAPASLVVGFAGYASPDGGTLQIQVPCGNGDGNLDAGERVTLMAQGTVAVPPPPLAGGVAIRLLSPNPTRGALRARVDAGAAERVTVELIDVSGRLVRRLQDGSANGPFVVGAALDECAPGIYFLRARAGTGSATARCAVIP
jgi:hypothetical protein